MPAQSEVSICNLAMTALSSSRIESLTQNNENARKCNSVYTFLRDNMLSNHNWNFAKKEANLAAVDEDPIGTIWTQVYQIPTDCLRVLEQDGQYDFEVIGDRIYNNESSCKITYIARITDTAKFPAYFAKALAADIAATLAFGITQNATLSEGMKKIAMAELKNAKWSDAQEGATNTSITGSFITARQA